MNTTLNIIGLVCGFAGSILWFCDGHRVAKIFTANSFTIGYGKEYDTLFWRYCGRVGIAMVGIGFLLQLVAYRF